MEHCSLPMETDLHELRVVSGLDTAHEHCFKIDLT